MFLSRFQIDTNKINARLALANQNVFHGAVARQFEVGRRVLWRVDDLGGKKYLLLVSEDKPELHGLVEQFGAEGTDMTRDYDALLSRCEPGTRWLFRLVANPTYAYREQKYARGKVRPHLGLEHQMEWLFRKAKEHGFAVSQGSFRVTGSQWVALQRQKGKGGFSKLLAVTYEGELTVTDKEKFITALTCGIGREKAFGMGMMTVISGRSR